VVRYNTFGATGIDFNVILRASDFSSKALVTHEFIKRLHVRFQREGIDTSSPTETIVRMSPAALTAADVA
jgi:small-conductance mechanosensitive channel